MLSSLYASFFVALTSCTGTSCHRRVSGVNEFLDFGDKTEEAGINSIYSLMQDIKFLKQQFQQQDLHLLEQLAASSETLMAGLCPLTSCLNCQWCWLRFGLITRRSLASQSAPIVRSDTLFFSCPQLCVNKKVQQNGMKSNPKDGKT